MRARRASWALGGAAGVAAAVLLTATVDRAALAATWEAVASAPGAVAVALAAYALAFAVRAFAWSAVLPGLRPGHALAALHLSLAANHLLPLRLGEAVRVTAAVRRGGVPLRQAAASTVLLRGADLVAALALALVLGPGLLPGAGGAAAGLALALAVLAAAGGLVWLRRLTGGSGAGVRPAAATALGAALAAWALEAVLVWQATRWAGLELGFGEAVAVTAVVVAAQALAVAPGGLGTYEAAATGALVALGADAGSALAAALAAHALSAAYALVGGALALAVPAVSASRHEPASEAT